MTKRLFVFLIILILASVLSMKGWVRAEEGAAYPFMEQAPDGRAWTIREALPNPSDATNKVNPSCWYPKGEVISVGERNGELVPKLGEHAYAYERRGIVPVWQWTVTHSKAKCIHNDEHAFHGITAGSKRCLASYYSGWQATCADCGEVVNHFYIYASREKIGRIRLLDLDLDYYYLCPTCDHLEMGASFRHVCKGISANRYQVKYLPNAGDVSGRMQPSLHIYDNQPFYEGEPVTPVTTLSLCSYERSGYLFLGWNLAPDGSGTFFEDGQEILNLSQENYDPKTGEGVVPLYAQWKKVTGNLLIDPGKGSYLGKGGITRVTLRHGEKYCLVREDVIAPKGFRIHFDPMGGDPLEDVVGEMRLYGWRLEKPSHGELKGTEYVFCGEDGETDKVTAIYQGEGIPLPKPEREGYSFGGWYADQEFTRQVGREGDVFTPSEDVTLYASWVELVLWARLNLFCYDGKGAVDLSWQQMDKREKSYLIWQKREGDVFRKIYRASKDSLEPETFHAARAGKEETYEVPSTGFYEVEAKGAQGQNAGSCQGGLGGYASGRFYLEKGDVLTIVTGGQDGVGGGGLGLLHVPKGEEWPASGGGSTRILSRDKGLLVVAGGGGSATPAEDGGAGGTEDGLREDGAPEGENGDAGGGGGYVGGISGTYQLHVHTEACLHVHQGNTRSGGPCYEEVTEEKKCHLTVRGPFIDWNQSDDCYACIAAGRAGRGSIRPKCWWIEHHGCGESTDYGHNGWWECMICGKIYYQWGSGISRPTVREHAYLAKSYVLNCDQIYDCGDPAPVISQAHGGSNYVNQTLALHVTKRAGVQAGDGEANVRPLSVGFLDACELREVYAPDLAPPRAIDENSLVIAASGENVVSVRFAPPEDLGTVYYHRAESYLAGSDAKLSDSNVTATEVVSGVAGYYYLVDERRNVAVTRENARGRIKSPELAVTITGEEAQFLHLAPVDQAGNVGESISIDLSPDKIDAAWAVVTTPIQISSQIAGRDYGSVSRSGDGTIYVRADGRTPFLLSFSAALQGRARIWYQVDRMTYVFSRPGTLGEGSFSAYLPRLALEPSEREIGSGDVRRMTVGLDVLQGASHVRALRSEEMRVTQLEQSFTLDSSQHGKRVSVRPSAGASHGDGEQCSDKTEDERNGIFIVGDGEAPEILGWDQVDDVFQAFYKKEEAILELTARDEHSGVAKFWVEVRQGNTGEIAVFHADAHGKIRIDFMENEAFFSGDVMLSAYARDRVGNDRTLEHSTKEFELRTEIVRMLEPHAPIFKRGESGILKITVRGYAESLEVIFPEEFSHADDGLDRRIVYETPAEEVREEVTFMVPLELVMDGGYQVIVLAKKGSETLVGRPELCTIQVADSLLGEIRTRLR